MGQDYTSSGTGHYIQVNGMNMYYEDHGKGYPVILLHGGLSTGRTSWSKHIPILSPHFRLIVPDGRGRGKTDNPLQKFSYRLFAEDTIALCKALSLKKPIICGWSDGGQTALEIGIHYPDFARAIIVGGSVTAITDHYLKVIKKMGLKGAGDVDIDKLKENRPEYVDRLTKLHSSVYGSDYWKTLLQQISHMWFDQSGLPGDYVQKIAIPCLLIIGDRDAAISIEEYDKMYRIIPHAELCVLPNTTHSALHNENPELFSKTVIDFIKRQLE